MRGGFAASPRAGEFRDPEFATGAEGHGSKGGIGWKKKGNNASHFVVVHPPSLYRTPRHRAAKDASCHAVTRRVVAVWNRAKTGPSLDDRTRRLYRTNAVYAYTHISHSSTHAHVHPFAPPARRHRAFYVRPGKQAPTTPPPAGFNG